jgi:hypothetical protein
MADAVLGPNYSGTSIPIQQGDRVVVDGRHGEVQLVCPPGSDNAINYSCTISGGLLIMFFDGILELLHYGSYHEINKEDSEGKGESGTDHGGGETRQ